jgi:glycosyltransferase involved in cell wall biosynthesis
MKIIQIVQKSQLRGAEIFAFQLSEKLRNLNHKVKLVYLYSSEKDRSLPLRKDDSIIGARENHIFEKFPGWNPRILQILHQRITEFQPDIVQVNAARTVKYGSILRRFDPKAPWRLVYRNIGDPSVWLRSAWRKWVYQNIVIPRVNGIVAVSSKSFGVLQSFYSSRYKIVTIPRGIEPSAYVPKTDRVEFRNQVGIPCDSPVLIFIGSLTGEKRVDRLVRMMKDLTPFVPEMRLWILGDGPLRKSLEELSAELGVKDLVTFFGLQKDVSSFLNAADLLVLCSETEGIPGVVLEAGLFGVPSVATRVGGVMDCIVDGQTGILVDPDDEAGFGSSVLGLIENKQMRIKMGENSKQWVHERFTMDEIAKRYILFYEELLEDRKGN